MHMIRHNHVADQQKFIAFTNLPQRPHKQTSRPHRLERRQTVITAEREKMQIAPAIVALQFLGHKPNSTPRVTPTRGARSFPYALVYLQQWHPLSDETRQVETTGNHPSHPSHVEVSNGE